MADADLEQAFNNPGQLALNPSSLYPGAYPGGGTALGIIREVEFDYGLRYVPIVAEEWGQKSEDIQVGEFPRLALVLCQRDPALVQAAFRSVTTSASPSGLTGISRVNGGARPGLVTEMAPLIFWPDDKRHPAVLIHRPLARVVGVTKFARREEHALVLVFDPTPNASGFMYQIDLLEHLALTA